MITCNVEGCTTRTNSIYIYGGKSLLCCEECQAYHKEHGEFKPVAKKAEKKPAKKKATKKKATKKKATKKKTAVKAKKKTLVKGIYMGERVIADPSDEARELYDQSRYGSMLEDGRLQLNLLLRNLNLS